MFYSSGYFRPQKGPQSVKCIQSAFVLEFDPFQTTERT